MPKMTRRHVRDCAGSLLAENVAACSVLFFVFFVPCVDLSVLAFRMFFLSCAANQSASDASKAKSYLQALETAPGVFSPSACELGRQSANQMKRILPGIKWRESQNNPDIQIIAKPLNPAAATAQPLKVFSLGNGAPLEGQNAPDQSVNVYLCRVVIRGQVEPLLTLPWFDVPGLSGPVDVTVSSEALYENIAGLSM
jgi:hypothetical protein